MMDSEATDADDENLKSECLLSVNSGELSHGQIQKISEEGGKNTYVLILSKDYLKSESNKGQTLLKCMSAGQKDKTRSKTTESGFVNDRDFESPSEITVGRRKLHHIPEDVKLNLSNINDDEYDSNRSASSVFLQESEQDSAIDVDHDHSNVSHNFFCDKSKMNTYIVPSPIRPSGSEKRKLEQHTFKTTSPLKIDSDSPFKSSFQHDRPSSQTSARKIVLVTPTHDKDGGQSLKKSVTYSNDAVPVMGRSRSSFQTPSSLLQKTSSKAVPTFSNISPISQQTNPKSNNTFVPISVAETSNYGAASSGPFTSTPNTGEPHRRLQQLKQESSSHRSVYVIPSPFSRQTSNWQSSKTDISYLSSTDRTPNSLNNSSGFISGSSSLETPDGSQSFDGDFRASMDHRSSPMKCKEISVEVHVQDCNVDCNDGSGGVVIKVAENEDIEDLGIDYSPMTSSQESESGDTADKAGLNRSLTNIQWLKGMQLQDEKSTSQSSTQQQQNIQWSSLSSEDIKQISAECGRYKRPPFSYMAMIQMALTSREDRKMMLKEICQWIEDTFPYYRHTAKRGWRNSIRHNLSLYNIFERESTKRHGSYWTIKSDVERRTKNYHREKPSSSKDTHSSLPTLPSQIPIIPIYSSMGQLSAVTPQTFNQSKQFTQNTASKKKGPPPILPRPDPYGTSTPYNTTQAYALIPVSIDTAIGAPSPNLGQQRMVLNLPGSGHASACPSPVISEVSAAVASIQVSSASPIPQEHFCDSINFQQDLNYNKPMNITKQAWISCQTTDTTSSIDSDKPMDVMSSSDIVSSNEFASNTSRTKSKRPRVKPGLPKPTIYKNKQDEEKTKTSNSKRRKLHQKEKTFSHESSDEEDGSKFISNIEKEIFSKQYTGKNLENREIEELMATSTPAKSVALQSTDLPSPISGLTPFKSSSLFDTSFLETLNDRKMLGLFHDSDGKKSLTNSPRIEDCLSDFNVLDGSPNHNNHNLSGILSECGLDSAMMDNVENFPNLSWSAVQQMVDSMDTD
ncbi:Forkhead box protein M1 [Mactra antiquata]